MSFIYDSLTDYKRGKFFVVRSTTSLKSLSIRRLYPKSLNIAINYNRGENLNSILGNALRWCYRLQFQKSVSEKLVSPFKARLKKIKTLIAEDSSRELFINLRYFSRLAKLKIKGIDKISGSSFSIRRIPTLTYFENRYSNLPAANKFGYYAKEFFVPANNIDFESVIKMRKLKYLHINLDEIDSSGRALSKSLFSLSFSYTK